MEAISTDSAPIKDGLSLPEVRNERNHERTHRRSGERIDADDLAGLRRAVGMGADVAQELRQHEQASR